MTDTAAKFPAPGKSVAPAPVQNKATSEPRTGTHKTALPAAAPLVKAVKPAKAPTVKKTAPTTKPAAVVKKKSPTKAAKPIAVPKPAKAKKPKMVRDSMTMPKAEYAVLAELKLRAAKLERPIKKTELLRAGIKALAAMSDTGFLVALKAVPSLKTGRPSKS